MSDRQHMSTAQVKIMAETSIKAKLLEMAGFLVLVTVYLLARAAHKFWGIEIVEVVALAGWFSAKLTAKSPEKTTELGLLSMPPKRVQRIYERVMSRRPLPTPRVPSEADDQADDTPLKRQPHHRRE